MADRSSGNSRVAVNDDVGNGDGESEPLLGHHHHHQPSPHARSSPASTIVTLPHSHSHSHSQAHISPRPASPPSRVAAVGLAAVAHRNAKKVAWLLPVTLATGTLALLYCCALLALILAYDEKTTGSLSAIVLAATGGLLAPACAVLAFGLSKPRFGLARSGASACLGVLSLGCASGAAYAALILSRVSLDAIAWATCSVCGLCVGYAVLWAVLAVHRARVKAELCPLDQSPPGCWATLVYTEYGAEFPKDAPRFLHMEPDRPWVTVGMELPRMGR